MLRMFFLIAALLASQVALVPAVAAPTANADAARGRQQVVSQLWDVMGMDALMPLLRDEALIEAESMRSEMFAQGREAGWRDRVAQIHDPARLEALFRRGVQGDLSDLPDPQISMALDFYRTALGQRLIRLETSARLAMLDPAVEQDAREAFSKAASHSDPRVEQIGRLIEDADLIGPNVAAGMNAAVAFSQGFAQAGGFDMAMTEEQMLADAWSQEPGLRAETLGWMEAYLMLAYSPLSDDELERYIEFAGSDAGQSLSAVLFAGFDALVLQTSRDLGTAAAAQMQGRDL